MAVIIGDTPEPLWVRLTPSTEFLFYLDSPTPYAAIPVLRFQATPEIIWSSSLSNGNLRATFLATAEQVNAVITACKTKNVRLTYGTRSWAVGKLEVIGPW